MIASPKTTAKPGDPKPRRVFLFLQGPSSLLFQTMADHLESFGHTCLRVNICAGDRVFWRRAGATNYRGSFADWPEFIRSFVRRNGVDALVLLGEQRPYHKAAAEVAKQEGCEILGVEIGYLRPDWLSIEHDGAGANSHFPKDPAVITDLARGLDKPDMRVRYTHTFFAEACLDLAYNLPNVFLWFLHPHFRGHSIYHPIPMYLSWVRLLLSKPFLKRRTARNFAALGDKPYFLMPLQLESDYAIRAHSPFDGQAPVIKMVLKAFAEAADASTHMLLKIHPLDNGLINWWHVVDDIAASLDLSGRVHVVRGGDLADMLAGALGVVTINSTVGMHTVHAGRPLKALGTAIYDIEGLTDSRPLTDFFAAPAQPDPALRDSFLALIAASLHERGNFFSVAGARAAAEALAKRIHENRVDVPGTYGAQSPSSKS